MEASLSAPSRLCPEIESTPGAPQKSRGPDAALELRRERRHPADDHRRLDPIVQSRQVSGAYSAHRQPHAADPAGIDFRPGEEIVHGANVVPEHDARPREPGGEDGPAD